MRCPVCRADNDTGPLCRRCKADLAPLFELEARRTALLDVAACAAARADGAGVVHSARQALLLYRGTDALRWLAVGHLLQRQFSDAVRCWRRRAEQPMT